MTRFENIPYRHWRGRKHAPRVTEPGKKTAYANVMRIVGDAMKSGKSVTMNHAIVNSSPRYGKPYDTITVTIQD